MKFVAGLTCHLCGATYPPKALWVCSDCLGPLEVSYDYDGDSQGDQPRADRVAAAVAVALPGAAAGRGAEDRLQLRLHAARARDAAGAELGSPSSTSRTTRSTIRRSPTRTASSRWRRPRAVELGFPVFGCASTGNLAGSVAAHAARLGLPCYVFIPHDLEPAKILGAAIYRPHVVAVEGNYDDVNRLCTQIADRYGWGFANINLRSYYAEGAKTMGFEIAEQLGWRYPDHIVSPVAGGTLLPRIYKGLREFSEVGLVEGDAAAIHAAQPTGSAPVIRALEAGSEFPDPVKPNTIAKSLAIGNPADGFQVVKVVKETGGSGAMVSDEEILDAIQLLAQHGRHLHRAGGRHDARGHARADRSAA